MKVLVTGGAGYIGSHTVRLLLEKGHNVIVLDNLVRGHRKSIPENVKFYEVDLADLSGLRRVFRENQIDAVIHFAAFLEVGESMVNPKIYYRNNVANTVNLLDAMLENDVKRFIFSSTAAIFGSPREIPITENAEKKPVNVYGRTKLVIEGILEDYDLAYGLKSVCLRYFNAAGAGFGIGEDHEPETHLIPLILQVALGKRGKIKIFGTDYPTPDGTCIRDYVHVIDLAEAHFLALEKLIRGGKSEQYNLGSGNGYSVREVIDSARSVTGCEIFVEEVERRAGDPEVLVADSSKIKLELGWRAKFGLGGIVGSAWEWHRNNPEGFGDS